MANKSEAKPPKRQVSKQEGKKFALQQHCRFTEVSAASGAGVDESLQTLVKELTLVRKEGEFICVSPLTTIHFLLSNGGGKGVHVCMVLTLDILLTIGNVIKAGKVRGWKKVPRRKDFY